MSIDEDFAEFVAARWGALYRLAYLLAASPDRRGGPVADHLGEGPHELGAHRADGVRRGIRAPDARQPDGLEPTESLATASEHRTGCPRWLGTPAQMPVLDRSLLWPLVCALPDRQRAVIVLRYYEDLSEAQIAEVLGCAPGTVKSQSSAAITALRRAVAATGDRRGGGRLMTLGDELRAALGQEAEMQNVVRPDVAQLIVGGRARKRRRNAHAGRHSAALVVVLLGGGVYGDHAARRRKPRGLGDRGPANVYGRGAESGSGDVGRGPGPRGPRAWHVPRPGGLRFVRGSPIEADLTVAGPGWRSGNFPGFAGLGERPAGSASTSPFALAAASGCSDDLVLKRVWARARNPSRSCSPNCQGARSSNPSRGRRGARPGRRPSEVCGSPRTVRPPTTTGRQRRHVAAAASPTPGRTRSGRRS